MSILSGMTGGGGSSYSPARAPRPPGRQDNNVDNLAMRRLRKLARTDSTAKSILGGSAPKPTSSYAMALLNRSGM